MNQNGGARRSTPPPTNACGDGSPRQRSYTVQPTLGQAIVTLLMGGVVLLGGGLYLKGEAQLDDGHILVEGTVIDVRSYEQPTHTTYPRTRTLYQPVVSYADPATGETYVRTSSTSSSTEWVVGSTADVAYPPGNPAAGRVLDPATNKLMWFWLAFGLLVMVAGTFNLGLALLRPVASAMAAQAEPEPV